MPEHSATSQRTIVSRILVVDDAPEVADLRLWLKARGYEVHLARDAGQARSLVTTRRPDFVLTEGLLPQETGFELCSFLKRQDETLPVVMLTEIDLDPARNLAIWCGADGYLTKPYDFETLEEMIGAVADAVWLRTHMAGQETQGRIEFECKCGKRMAVRQENAGKGVQCPKCAQIVIAPKFSALQSGTWKRTSAPEGTTEQSRRADLFCSRCGHFVFVTQHARHNHAVCGTCGHKQNVPRWLLDHRRFYFQPPVPEVLRGQVIRQRLRRFLTVTCAACSARYAFDPHHPESACRCTSCGHVDEHPSLRNSPLAKAALASTGRLFSVHTGRQKSRKFLLPEDQELRLGSGDACQLRFAERQVAPFHCALWWSEHRAWVKPLSLNLPTLVNKVPIEGPLRLEPGDVVGLGSVRLLLMGNRNLDLFQDEQPKSDRTDEESLRLREARIARQAATVLQLHWEHQRDWLLAHPEWSAVESDEPDENAESTAPAAEEKRRWSLGDRSTHVLVSDTPGETPSETQLTSRTSARLPQIPATPPPLKLPDPTTCGPAQPAAETPQQPLSIRERKRQEQSRPADQAAQIISGIHQRPLR